MLPPVYSFFVNARAKTYFYFSENIPWNLGQSTASLQGMFFRLLWGPVQGRPKVHFSANQKDPEPPERAPGHNPCTADMLYKNNQKIFSPLDKRKKEVYC